MNCKSSFLDAEKVGNLYTHYRLQILCLVRLHGGGMGVGVCLDNPPLNGCASIIIHLKSEHQQVLFVGWLIRWIFAACLAFIKVELAPLLAEKYGHSPSRKFNKMLNLLPCYQIWTVAFSVALHLFVLFVQVPLPISFCVSLLYRDKLIKQY